MHAGRASPSAGQEPARAGGGLARGRLARTLLLEPLRDLKPVLHRAGLRGDPPGVLSPELRGVAALRDRHAPLRAVRGQFRVDDPASRSQAGEKGLAALHGERLGAMHGLVRLELRPGQRIPDIGADSAHRLAAVTPGEAGKVVGHGGALGERHPGHRHAQRERRQGQGPPDAVHHAVT